MLVEPARRPRKHPGSGGRVWHSSRPREFVSPALNDLLEELMDSAGRRADYADARHVRSRAESISTRNGAVDELLSDEAEGVGVRVRVGGAWGFAATRELDRQALERALARALDVAAAQPRAPKAPLADEPAARGRWQSPFEIDPFEVPLEDKLALLSA